MTFYVLAQVNEEGDAIPLISCVEWLDGVPLGASIAKSFRKSVLSLLRAEQSLSNPPTSIENYTASELISNNPDLVGLVLTNVDPIIDEQYVTAALEQQEGNLLLKWLEMAEEEEKDAI